MTWNYRVVRKGGEYYGIHEVYYDDGGNPEMVTVEPVGAAGDTFDELVDDFTYMLRAFGKPILDYEDIGGEIGGQTVKASLEDIHAN